MHTVLANRTANCVSVALRGTMNKRQEFSDKTKFAAWTRCSGYCEHCGNKIITTPRYTRKKRGPNGETFDHGIPDYFDGSNNLENCQVLCDICDGAKTSKDQSDIAHSKRILKKSAGIKKKSRPMLGTRASGWRKPMNGKPERW